MAEFLAYMSTGFPVGGWSRFALDAIWQTTLIGLVSFGVLLALRKRPAARSWIAMLSLSLCVTVPLLSVAARAMGYGMLRPALVGTTADAGDVVSIPLVISTAGPRDQVPAADAALRRFDAQFREIRTESPKVLGTKTDVDTPRQVRNARVLAATWMPWLASVGISLWGVASMILAFRLTRNAWAVRQLVKTARICHDQAINQAARRAATQLGIRSTSLVVGTDRFSAPSVVSFSAVRLIIPSARCTSHSQQQWYSVFCHELAHVRRRDGWTRLLAELATVCYPWQPLIWSFRQILIKAAEEACDDWALATGSDPTDYAELLKSWVPGGGPRFAMGMARSITGVRQRILRLLSLGTEMIRPQVDRRLVYAGATISVAAAVLLAVCQSPGTSFNGSGSLLAGENNSPFEKKAVEEWDGKMRRHDRLEIWVSGTIPDYPIHSLYTVQHDGEVVLGPLYGSVHVEGMKRKQAEETISKHLASVLSDAKVSVTVQPRKSPWSLGPTYRPTMGRQAPVLKIRVLDAETVEIAGTRWQLKDIGRSLALTRQVAQASGFEPNDVSIVLRVGADASVKNLQPILQQCRGLGMERVTLSLDEAAPAIAPFDRSSHRTGAEDLTSIDIDAADEVDLPTGVPPVRRGAKSAERVAAAASSESNARRPVYRIEPPDVLKINSIRMSPKSPYHIRIEDALQILVSGTPPDNAIAGSFQVEPNGSVMLGPSYGFVKVAGMTTSDANKAITKHLQTMLREPKVSVSLLQISGQQAIAGEHLVAPDGYVNLGIHGRVYVAGMTIEGSRSAIESHLSKTHQEPLVSVEVWGYNSRFVYVVLASDGEEEQVLRVPLMGNDTILDIIAQSNLGRISTRQISILRPDAAGPGPGTVLPVDWEAITKGNSTATNYQLLPRDRVFIGKVGSAREAVSDF